LGRDAHLFSRVCGRPTPGMPPGSGVTPCSSTPIGSGRRTSAASPPPCAGSNGRNTAAGKNAGGRRSPTATALCDASVGSDVTFHRGFQSARVCEVYRECCHWCQWCHQFDAEPFICMTDWRTYGGGSALPVSRSVGGSEGGSGATYSQRLLCWAQQPPSPLMF
jgi:hypothetical protein